MYVENLCKTFISQDILLDFRKVTKYKLSTFIGPRVIKNSLWGGGGGGGGGKLKAFSRIRVHGKLAISSLP